MIQVSHVATLAADAIIDACRYGHAADDACRLLMPR